MTEVSRDVADYDKIIRAACMTVFGSSHRKLARRALGMEIDDILQEARAKSLYVLRNYVPRGQDINLVVYLSVQNFCFNLLRKCSARRRSCLKFSATQDQAGEECEEGTIPESSYNVVEQDSPEVIAETRILLEELLCHKSKNVREVVLWRLGGSAPDLSPSQVARARCKIRQFIREYEAS